jgi:hypothetical protein
MFAKEVLLNIHGICHFQSSLTLTELPVTAHFFRPDEVLAIPERFRN